MASIAELFAARADRRSPLLAASPGHARARLLLLAALAALLYPLGGSATSAHPLYLVPKWFAPAPGARLAIEVWVGHGEDAGPMPRSAEHLERFFATSGLAVADGGSDFEVVGVEQARPAGVVRLAEPGLWIVGYRSRPVRMESTPEQFERFLEEEGLEGIARRRRSLGEERRPTREIHSRCAATLIRVAGQTRGGSYRPLGCELELVPLGDPFTSPQLELQLLLRGRPLADAQIGVWSLGVAEETAARGNTAIGPVRLARSDGDGLVTFPATPGRWLFNVVWVERGDERAWEEWRGLWSSLTVSLGAAPLHTASPPVPAFGPLPEGD